MNVQSHRTFFCFQEMSFSLAGLWLSTTLSEVGTCLPLLLLSLLKLLSEVLQLSSMLPTKHPHCCRLSCFLTSRIPARHRPSTLRQLTACGGSFQIPNLVYKTSNDFHASRQWSFQTLHASQSMPGTLLMLSAWLS